MPERSRESEKLTFLFTDVERSSEAWLKRSLEMTTSIPAINGIVESRSTAHDGTVFGREGDGRAVHFRRPESALDAAVAIQDEIARHPSDTGGLRLRIGVHSGSVYRLHDGQLGGTPLNYVGRMHSAGHGGQILVSSATKALLGTGAERFRWTDLGVYSLRDFSPDRLWQIDGDDEIGSFPPLRTRRRFEAPRPVADPFFGRSTDLDALDPSALRSPITTLTGPGGIGKTRLVRALIESHGDRFSDGVCFVDLQRVSRSKQVVDAVANALGIDPNISDSPLQSIRDALIGSDALVILDNCEHVRDGAAAVARAICEADGPTVVATSRSPLRVKAERVHPIGPLPGAADGAPERERLFTFAARLARPDFELDDDTEPLVTAICERLGGVPLAIELAAARLTTLGVRDLVDLLDDDLALIDSTDGDVRSSIRSAVRWSIDALDPDSVELAVLLAHSRPDAGLRELEQLSEQPGPTLVEALHRLITTGLVAAERVDDAYRYRMLEPLRRPLTTLNGSSPVELHARRARIYAEVARLRGADVLGPDEAVAVRALTADVGNVRTGFLHDVTAGEVERAARTVVALHMYGFLRMRYEVYSWVDTVLEHSADISADLIAELTGMAAFRAFNQGRLDDAMALARHADELTPAGGQVTSRVVLMATHGMAGRYDLANEELQAGLRWCDEHEQPTYRTNLHVVASMGLTTQGVFDVAGDLAHHALDLAEDIANPSAVAWALTALADAQRRDSPDEATRVLHSALEIARSVGNRWVEGQALLNLTRAERSAGRLDRAVEVCVDALAHCQQQANHIQTRQGLREAFLLLHELGEHDLAAQVMRPMLARPDTLPPSPDQHALVDEAVSDVSRRAADGRSGPRLHSRVTTERDAVAVARSRLIELAGTGS